MKNQAVIADEGALSWHPSEITRLLLVLVEALPEPSRSIVSLMVRTGLRIGEILALPWRNVDLENRILTVEETVYEGHFDEPKTRASKRHVPLSVKAAKILKLLMPKPVNREALAFSTKKGTPICRRNLMNRAALRLPRVTWHTLRHCNATLLDHVGTPRGTVTAILGHESQEITARYVHSLPAGAHEAVEKVEALLTGFKRTQIAEIENSGSTLIQ